MDFKLPNKPEELLKLAGPIIGVVVLLLALIGVGAGSSEDGTSPTPSTTAKPTTTATKTTAAQPAPSTSEKPSGKFENNIFDSHEYRFEITKVNVVPAGGRENLFGSKPVIVFTYEFTNKRAREIDTITAWLTTFSAKQEDENVRHDLRTALFYTDDLADQITVKPGGKVTAQFAYELNDEDLPVALSAQTGLLLKNSEGTQVYPIK